ncbi:hypothetical protein ACP4OV_012476 [Aristida adscensionis]
MVTTTTGGFVFLADKQQPHATRVLNPFTGSLIRLPSSESNGGAAELVAGEFLDRPGVRSSMLLLGSCAVEVANGEMLHAEQRPDGGIALFRIDSASRVTEERVTGIGSHAIFHGRRCLSIDAANFPSIKANCVYYNKSEFRSVGSPIYDISMYDLALDVEETIPHSYNSPVTLPQLLYRYTDFISGYQLARDKLFHELVLAGRIFRTRWPREIAFDMLLEMEDDDEFDQ